MYRPRELRRSELLGNMVGSVLFHIVLINYISSALVSHDLNLNSPQRSCLYERRMFGFHVWEIEMGTLLWIFTLPILIHQCFKISCFTTLQEPAMVLVWGSKSRRWKSVSTASIFVNFVARYAFWTFLLVYGVTYP